MASAGGGVAEWEWDAGPSTELPELTDIPGVELVGDPVQELLDTVYFDTATLALAARRITLFRRTGEPDHGWRLSVLDRTGTWQEIHAPLGQPETVPEELLEFVLASARGESLLPVARLLTWRTTYRLYGEGGEHLLDFIDDRFQVEASPAPGPGDQWRTWGLRVVRGTFELLNAAAEILTEAGVRRSTQSSTLERVFGDVFPPVVAASPGRPRKKGPAVAVVSAYLDDQITELLAQDPFVRRGQPGAIHQMRSTIRRMRSVLATYRTLFTSPEIRMLEGELKWLARILGRPRDAEVLRERLRHHLQDLPKELRSEVAGPIEQDLGTAYNSSYRAVLTALESQRYYRLLDGLEQFRDHPPVNAHANLPARIEAIRLVNKVAKRLDRAHLAAKRTKGGGARDAALHEVRKGAKQLRHAADSVAGIQGKRARTVARAARGFQRILGEQHDSVVSRTFLGALAANTALPEKTVLAYKLMQGLEDRAAHAAEKKYLTLRKKSSGIRLRH